MLHLRQNWDISVDTVHISQGTDEIFSERGEKLLISVQSVRTGWLDGNSVLLVVQHTYPSQSEEGVTIAFSIREVTSP